MQVYYLSSHAHPESFGSFIKKFCDEGTQDELAPHIAKISHIADRGGHPQPPYAKPLREVDGGLNEICSKLNEKEHLRIYYFVKRETKRMILLNITIKPTLYEGGTRKRVEKEIQESIEEALRIKEQYITSQNDYEKL